MCREFKRLPRAELSRVAEIDRTERIDLIYEQHGTELEERRGNGASPAWDEHEVEAHRQTLERYVDAGGIGRTAGGDRRGYELMAPALPELYELEPEDVHMRKTL